MTDQTKTIDVTQYLKSLSEDDFRELGKGQVAYIRKSDEAQPQNGISYEDLLSSLDGDGSYVICDANGTPLSRVDDYDAAVKMLQYQNIKPVTMH